MESLPGKMHACRLNSKVVCAHRRSGSEGKSQTISLLLSGHWPYKTNNQLSHWPSFIAWPRARVRYCPISQIPDFCNKCYFCSCFRSVINTLRYRVYALILQVCPNFSDLTALHRSPLRLNSVHPSLMALKAFSHSCKLAEFIWVLEA